MYLWWNVLKKKWCLDLPFRIEVTTVVCLRIIVLLQLAVVLVELLVIHIGLNLVNYLLGSWSWPVLSLRQLLHCCRIHVVNLSTSTYNCTSLILLCIYNGLRLGLRLRLSNLQVQALDLVHQRRYILIVATPRNNLRTYLLQSVSGNAWLHNWRLTYYLGSSMCVMQLCYISRQLSVSSLPRSWMCILSNNSLTICRILTCLHVATQLLGTQAEQVCVLIVHVGATV